MVTQFYTLVKNTNNILNFLIIIPDHIFKHSCTSLLFMYLLNNWFCLLRTKKMTDCSFTCVSIRVHRFVHFHCTHTRVCAALLIRLSIGPKCTSEKGCTNPKQCHDDGKIGRCRLIRVNRDSWTVVCSTAHTVCFPRCNAYLSINHTL